MTVPRTEPAGRPREIWTRVTVDPLAEPLAQWLSRRRLVTPNRLTALAGGFAVGSATSFAVGSMRVGGLLFLVRFFVDCLDGKVARVQRRTSTRGAVLDLGVDVGGIALVVAALSWTLVREDLVAAPVSLALLASMVFYSWALSYRKDLARQLGLGDGGADHRRGMSAPVVGRWVSFCRSVNMSPVPWAVEAEIVMLGLAPLLAPQSWLGAALGLGLAFYLVADAVNATRLWRLASVADRQQEGAPTP